MNRLPTEINAKCFREQGFTGKDVAVAIVDTGVSPVPDIKDALLASYQVENGRVSAVEPRDTYGHGTTLAGIIAGNGRMSNRNIQGMAPGAKIVSIRRDSSTVPDALERFEIDNWNIAEAIDWVTDHKDTFRDSDGHPIPIRVINCSFGVSHTRPDGTYLAPHENPVNLAVQRAWKVGIFVNVASTHTRSSAQPG